VSGQNSMPGNQSGRRTTPPRPDLTDVPDLQAKIVQLEEALERKETQIAALKDKAASTRAQILRSNKALRVLLSELFGISDAMASQDMRDPFDPVSIRVLRKERLATVPFATALLDDMVAGESAHAVLITLVRELLDRKPLAGFARRLAYGLAEGGGMSETAAMCCAIVGHNRGEFRRAFDLLDPIPWDRLAGAVPVEFLDCAYRLAPEIARARVAAIGAERKPPLPPATLLAIAGLAWGFRDKDQARRLLDLLNADRRVDEALSQSELAAFSWFREYDATTHRPCQTAGPAAATLGVLGYHHADLGRVSRNIGDYVQTLAFLGNLVRHRAFTFIGDADIAGFAQSLQDRVRADRRLNTPQRTVALLPVNRDAVGDHKLPPGTWLFVFGSHMHRPFGASFDFPYPGHVRPLFVSFHVADPEMVTSEAVSYLKRYAPIGCRDWSTAYLLSSRGIPAFFSGCLTTTIDTLFGSPAEPRGPEKRPLAFVDTAPASSEEEALPHESFCHEEISVATQSLTRNLALALARLGLYRDEFRKIVTSRLHCYLPCRSLGLDVEFRPRRPSDIRFDGLTDIADDRLAVMRVRLLATLAGMIEMITGGADEDTIRARWAELCAADVEAANVHRAQFPDIALPAAEIEAMCRPARSSMRVWNPFGATAGSAVDIALATDEGLRVQVPVMLESAVANASRPIRVWVLSRGLGGSYFSELAACFPETEFHVLTCDTVQHGDVVGLPAHVSVATMDRLLLPEMLPELNRVTYLDIDIAVLGDLAELADFDLAGMPLAAQARPRISEDHDRDLKAASKRLSLERAAELRRRLLHRFAYDFETYNAGLLVLDLEALRRDAFCANFLPYGPRYGMNDQDILSAYAGYRWRRLPPEWNVFPSYETIRAPKAIHWIGRVKPWQRPQRALYRKHWNFYQRLWLSRRRRITESALPD